MRILCLGLSVLALAACAGDEDEASVTSTATTTNAGTTTASDTGDQEPSRRTLRVYLVRDERVAAAERVVDSTEGVGAAALHELFAGANDLERAAGLSSAVPQGTELLGLAIANGVATVDLSRPFDSGGGSTSMQLRVAQVVYTLTQFPTVQRVRFRLEGRPVEAIGGEGVVVEPPVGRAAFEQQTPAILVEAPAPGAIVASPLRVRGTANTFEATLFIRVVDASGRTLFDNFLTATSGSGTRGTFAATLEFEVEREGPGSLIAYERSAEDGSEIHAVRIPVDLRR